MPTITSQIVQVAATITAAPTPSQLQQSGALVSVGGSTVATGSYQYCATLAQVTALLTSSGNYVELTNMATTFFAQQNAAGATGLGVYILELGAQASASAGITALQTWIITNPSVFYAYLTPVLWDSAGTALNTMAANFSSPTGKTYFVVTTTPGTMAAYAPTTKAIMALVPSPTAATTEFQAAALFYQWLSNNPSAANLAAPMDFRYVYGVTPWPITNNQATMNAILAADVNYIGTGAEGGISTAVIRDGTTMDGSQAMFWYAVDWILINAQQRLAATIINGSNSNPPLYYNQNGINRLIVVLEDLGVDGTSFGLIQNAVFTATPFITYTTANPGDYAAGRYNGLSCVASPLLGFGSLTFYLNALQFAS